MNITVVLGISATWVAAILSSGTLAVAEAKVTMPVSAHVAFERLKSLAGEWRGTEATPNNAPEVAAQYKITANGSVVLETLFPGSPHEMITLYHLDGEKLLLTHYCALANQPRMTLATRSSPDELIFDFSGGANIKPKKDTHMHSLRIRFQNKDKIATEWDLFEQGKKADTKKFFLTRKG